MQSMLAFISWYVIVSLLGWLTFPLVAGLFPGLADRGYSLARAAGLLIWAYFFWLFTSLGLTGNNVGGILFGLLPLIGLSLAAYFVRGAGSGARTWLRQNLRLVISVEILFLVAFAAEAALRAGNPTLDNAEKPMELMFINAILRSPTFPPHDSWLSGYAISYYYFGYVMTAMLAQLAGLTGSIAHNLMTALIFGLAAIGAYGIVYDLLAATRLEADDAAAATAPEAGTAGLALLAPLFLLVVSNIEGFLEVLHRLGVFWSGAQNFWTWLGIKDLNEAPALPLGWIPDRFWWWWRASRVISDFDLVGNFHEVIDEFPFFSFLHADLHPHVLAIPFNLLAIAIALHIFLGGWRGEIQLPGMKLHISPIGFLAAALTLGGLAFLNTWDILVGATLIVLAYVLLRVREEGWSWSRVADAAALGLPLGLAAVLLFLPFYFGFASQAGGILPNLIYPTRGAQLWVMFLPLFVALFGYLLYVWRGGRSEHGRGKEHPGPRWRIAILLAMGFVILLSVLSLGLGLLAQWKEPSLAKQFLDSQGSADIGALLPAMLRQRLAYIGGLLTLLAILVPALAFLLERRDTAGDSPSPARQGESKVVKRTRVLAPAASERNAGTHGGDHATAFVLLLILIGCVLVIAPDFVFLRDQFVSRLNTIFKFYYQAWLLWSVAAAFGTGVLLRRLRGGWDWTFRAVLAFVLILGLAYPALAVANKTNNFNPPLGWTLDDFQRIESGNPDEAAAILWLRSAPDGVVAEAVGGSYTGYARISEYTGQPAVIGWPGHESQWRGSYDPQGTRQADIAALYNTPDWDTANSILQQYGIRYVFVGGLERTTYTVQEQKFQQNLSQVFQRGAVTIYEVP